MKNNYIVALFLTVATTSLGAANNVKVRPLGAVKPSKVAPAINVADVLVNENFESFKEGTPENPDKTTCYGDQYGELASSEWIDPAMTHGAQWRGDLVYAAGGSCFIDNKDPQAPNWLKTPMGDYSGEVKVTFLTRALRTETASGVLSGSSLQVSLGSDKSSQRFDSDMPTENVRLYPNQGWCEVEMTFNNYSAYNDAYIEFTASGGILLDDIRVTAATDEFIASPVKLPVTDVKADGFTINWQGVRKSFNYYIFLYTLKGYDEEGNPEYEHVFSPEHLAMIENSGMSVEEYLEFMPEEYLTYNPAGSSSLDDINQRSYTFSGLDPEKEYYYDVRSHYVTMFSKPDIRHANVVSAPEAMSAEDITDHSFKARWKAAPKATSYEVTLYGVQHLPQSDEYYPLLDEEFNNVSDFTGAENISQSENLWETYGDDFDTDQLFSTPGWDVPFTDCIDLMKGHIGLNEWGGELATPVLDIAGADHVDLYLSMKSSVQDFPFYVSFAGKNYELKAEGTEFDGEIQLPTNGLDASLIAFANASMIPVFIDRIQVTQPKKAGARVFTWLDMKTVEAPETAYEFDNLKSETWECYAYDVRAVKTTDSKSIRSNVNDRILVNLKTKESGNGIEAVTGANGSQRVEIERYTMDGQRISTPVKGLNIIRYSDGSVRKIMVK